MLRLSSDIKITSKTDTYSFDFCTDVEINSSWENLTDTAKLTFPKRIRFKKDGAYTDAVTAGPDALWKRGDKIEISLGYNENNTSLFTGVLTGVSPKQPLEFTCEDDMFILKQTNIAKYSQPTVARPEAVTLKSLLTDIIPSGIDFTAEDITLGSFIIASSSVAEVLDYLKRKFGISSYFQNGALYAGFAYRDFQTIATGTPPEFEFYKNIIDDSNLDYIRDDDVSLNVTAINILKNNTRKKLTVGDSLGEKRTIYFNDVTDKELLSLATEALTKLKYEGFKGSFLTFLQPTVKHGDAVRMIDSEIPDRNGVYLVRRVVTRFGVDGGRQEITLDRKISS